VQGWRQKGRRAVLLTRGAFSLEMAVLTPLLETRLHLPPTRHDEVIRPRLTESTRSDLFRKL
jgi:hypothetical protein